MSKYIVSVFDEKRSAYDGARALLDLENEGSLVVYEGAIISKNDKGSVRIEDEAGEGPIGMVGGMLVGSLLGVLGGPVGMAVGAAVGTVGGGLSDLYNIGVGDDFLDEVGRKLTPGKSAVAAEVTENWTLPVDTRMEALGGTVFRTWRVDVEDEQIERDAEATRREMDELDEEWDHAVGEAKQKVKAKIDATRAKLKALDDRAKAKLATMKKEVKGKVEKLDAQIAKASAEMKQKYQKKRDELKADYDRRSEKLGQAGQLMSEALSRGA